MNTYKHQQFNVGTYYSLLVLIGCHLITFAYLWILEPIFNAL
jgi:hypothetical protein